MGNRILAGVLGIALAAAGCNDPTPPLTPTPAVPMVSDTFNGSLTSFATNSHPFIVNQIGGVKVTLTNVDPRIQLSIGIGTPSTTTGTCAVIQSTTTEPGTVPQL